MNKTEYLKAIDTLCQLNVGDVYYDNMADDLGQYGVVVSLDSALDLDDEKYHLFMETLNKFEGILIMANAECVIRISVQTTLE